MNPCATKLYGVVGTVQDCGGLLGWWRRGAPVSGLMSLQYSSPVLPAGEVLGIDLTLNLRDTILKSVVVDGTVMARLGYHRISCTMPQRQARQAILTMTLEKLENPKGFVIVNPTGLAALLWGTIVVEFEARAVQ